MNAIIEQLNLWGDRLIPFAMELLWQASLLMVVLLAIDLILRNRIRAGLRYALWMLLPIKLLLPPTLALPTGVGYWIDRSGPEPVMESKQPITLVEPDLQFIEADWVFPVEPEFVEPVATEPIPVTPTSVNLSRNSWMTLVWLTVATLLFGWMARRWVWVNCIVRKSVEADGELRSLAPEQIAIRVTDTKMSPALCGPFRPVILLPRLLVERLSREQIRTVILHELVHLRRGDLWVNCLQTLLQIAFWWHPLLWIANARIRRVREEAVDDAVASELANDEETYPQTLVEVAKLTFSRPLMALGLIGILESKNALKQRIRRLIDMQRVDSSRIKLGHWIVILMFGLIAVPMSQGWFPDRDAPDVGANNNPQSIEREEKLPSANASNHIVFSDAEMASLSNQLESAEAALDSKNVELAELARTLNVADVWMADPAVLNDPFVRRHVRELELTPPGSYLSVRKEVEVLRNNRDSIEIKFVQERINRELGIQQSDKAFSENEKFENGLRSISNRLSVAESQLSGSRNNIESLKRSLGFDPLADPSRIFPEDEFLEFIPFIEATVEMNRQSNVVKSIRMTLEKAKTAYRNAESEDSVIHPLNAGIQLGPQTSEIDLRRDRDHPAVHANLEANPSLDPSIEDFVNRGITLDTPSNPTITYLAATAQNSAELDRDGDPTSGIFPASSQAPPVNAQTIHTSKSGVITEISVVDSTSIDPVVQSKKLSEWFDQFCAGVSAYQRRVKGFDSDRADASIAEGRAAISESGTEALPYLLSQLRIDPTGEIEKQLVQLRNSERVNAATQGFVDTMLLPSSRRSCAAQLLGDVGAQAAEALPTLVELWSQHSERNRTPYYLGIQKILYGLDPRPEFIPNEFRHYTERLAFETNVVAAAISYCPRLPDDLRRQLAPLLKASEKGESKLAEHERLFTRTIKVNPNSMYHELEKALNDVDLRLAWVSATASPMKDESGQAYKASVTNDVSEINTAVRLYLEKSGVKLEPPKMLYFNPRTGLLMVRASLEDLGKIQHAVEALNHEPPQITFESSAVVMSADQWRELFKTERMRSESPVDSVFVHEGDPEAFLDRLRSLEGVRLLDAPRTTTLAGYVTSARSPSETDASTELRDGFEANLVFDVVEVDPSQLSVSANGKVTVSGQLKQNGELVPLSIDDDQQTESGENNGSVNSINAVGYVKHSLQSGKVTLRESQYLIMSDQSLGQARGSVAAIIVRAMQTDPAGNRMVSPDDVPFSKDPTQPAVEK